ncbi:MAG: hypothetical protein GC146_16670 [Limimaricola sp.]|uniref:hypothetical protein n=1 Tax=Limimaricola sp. TaxID=2211665 RepID=UPI001D27DB01|nr:hypothetical protein [Limimaricola sp.]MBI1418852.1 hypothetical protein [Limimaricola sp.]
MSGQAQTLMLVQVVLFFGWAFSAFRILFHLRRRAQDKTGQFLNGPFAFRDALGDWLADPAQTRPRRQFWVLTAAMMAASVASAVMAPNL